MITINGNTISTPTEFSVGVEDISKAERNGSGNLIIKRITTKRKLELNYNYLSNADMSILQNLLTATTFTVVYPDPVTGANRSCEFYCGGRSCGAIDYQGGVIRWQKMKFNLIEV